jgi:hypothetical protein
VLLELVGGGRPLFRYRGNWAKFGEEEIEKVNKNKNWRIRI